MAQIKFQISNSEKGITLVEIIIVIFIIALFSLILVSDFPKIQRQYALSDATYKLAQDVKKTQDLALSGVRITDQDGKTIAAKGYGVYINLIQSEKQYIIYADVADANGISDQKYSGDLSYPPCSQPSSPTADCVVEIIDLSKENPSLFIKQVDNISSAHTSINFRPPAPIVNIENFVANSDSKIGIVLGLTSNISTRTVWLNTSGLINVQ